MEKNETIGREDPKSKFFSDPNEKEAINTVPREKNHRHHRHHPLIMGVEHFFPPQLDHDVSVNESARRGPNRPRNNKKKLLNNNKKRAKFGQGDSHLKNAPKKRKQTIKYVISDKANARALKKRLAAADKNFFWSTVKKSHNALRSSDTPSLLLADCSNVM